MPLLAMDWLCNEVWISLSVVFAVAVELAEVCAMVSSEVSVEAIFSSCDSIRLRISRISSRASRSAWSAIASVIHNWRIVD